MNINNIIFFSFAGFVTLFLALLEIFLDIKDSSNNTISKKDIRVICILSILDGLFFLTFIGSLIIKLIKLFYL